jgi:hypothetical protein
MPMSSSTSQQLRAGNGTADEGDDREDGHCDDAYQQGGEPDELADGRSSNEVRTELIAVAASTLALPAHG